jgi:hypothetical protein
MPPASQTLFGSATAPDGSFQVCLTSGSFARSRALDVPAEANALVRYEVATGQFSLLAPVIGIAYGVTMSPDGAWIIVGLEDRWSTRTDGPEARRRLAVISSDGVGGLRLVGGEPYDLLLSGAGWASGGRAYFLACQANCTGQTAGYLYELDLASAMMRAVTHGWTASRWLGVARDGRVLLVRTRSGQPELHLVEPGTGGPVPARGRAIAPGPVPEEAVAVVGGLMEARIARDEGRARSYLDPNLDAAIGSADLLPPAEQQWSSFRYALALRDNAGRLRFTVQIFTATGTLEQVVVLEVRGGRWVVAWLGPITIPR